MCRCACGVKRVVCLNNLVSGHSRSCGCLRSETTSTLFRKHGNGYEDYRYRLWRTLLNKCYCITHRDYPYYGGRGVRVWEPWHDFERFREYLDRDLGPRPEGLTMDRIHNDGHYEPGNVRWASRQQQALNRRNRWREK